MDVNVRKKNVERGSWGNKWEFLLSCLGYAIGLGNVWRFPYMCYRNGGGAFLVPYLLMLFLCGIPLFFMETSLGQFSNISCLTLFRISPLLKGAGYAIIIVNVITSCYFNVIIAYPVVFLFHCFKEKLPWADCNNPWNTENCFELNHGVRNITKFGGDAKEYKSPADEFFHNQILQISQDVDSMGSIVWPLYIGNAFTWLVVFLCIMKGVKTVGKVVYFTATFPFVILFILLVRGLTLPGAIDGVIFYLYPDWKQLTNLKVWSDAACQIFFSLGPGWGGIINMASYNEFNNNNVRDSILVPIMNCGTSIFAGFVVFSVLGFMSHQTGLPIASVATGGPGLAFVTYPEAITMLPFPHIWAILFFLMLFFIGLDTGFVQIEALISSFIDDYPSLRRSKTLVTFLSCFGMFLVSTIFVTNGGMYYLQLLDWYAASISVILICFVEVLIVGWIYGARNFLRDVEFMINDRVHWWWPLCWRFITPAILVLIFITTVTFNATVTYYGVVYPEWSLQVGWCSCLMSILCIPAYMGYYLLYYSEGDLFERIKNSTKPNKKWGPTKESHRKEWLRLVYSKHINNQTKEVYDPLHEQFIQLVTTEYDMK